MSISSGLVPRSRRPIVWVLVLAVIAAVAAIAWAAGAGGAPGVVASPSPSEQLPPSPRPIPTATFAPTPTATFAPTPTATPIPTPAADRLTVLLIGTDSSAARRAHGDGVNTDAIHVVSISADRSQLSIVSLPRDTVDIPMSDGSLWSGKVNAMYGALGAEGLRDALETLYGIEIDRYVAIDMDDFVRIIDAIGGIDITLPAPIYDPLMDWGLAAGTHHLDGGTALRFARTRYGDDDYARSARQQQVLLALRDRVLALDEPIDVSALLEGLGSLDTDMTPSDHATFVDVAFAGIDGEVAAIVLGPPRFALFEGIEGPARGWVMIPDVEEIRREVQSLIAD